MKREESAKITKLIAIARNCAMQSDVSFRHGAVLFANSNKIISFGYNRHGDRLQKTWAPTIHAEASCLAQIVGSIIARDRSRLLRQLRILVIRISANGQLVNSMPCRNCVTLMRKFGVKRVIYSDENGNIVNCSINNIPSDYISDGYRHHYRI